MKLRHVLLAGVLAMTMFVSSAAAEEAATEAATTEEKSGGLLTSLFGEGGILEEALPEGVSVDEVVEIVDIAKKTLDNTDWGALMDDVLEQARGAEEGLSIESLKGYASSLLGRLADGDFEDLDEDSLESFVDAYGALREAENAYILDRNNGQMDFGDAQIISNYNMNVGDYTQKEFQSFCIMTQSNFKLNDQNQLMFVSSANDVILFTHQNEGNGSYPVSDAAFSEDGEGYAASIEAMCNEAGYSIDECTNDIEFSKVIMIYDLVTYLNEHPDVVGIEFEGQVKTAAELGEIMSTRVSEMFAKSAE